MSQLFVLILFIFISTLYVNGELSDGLNKKISSDPTGKSCNEDLDCGSNIKYQICDHKYSTSKQCRYCETDSECTENDNDICSDNGWCKMNTLMHSFDTQTIATIIAIFIGSFIAAGGGLGGGGIFVPVFILLLGFDTKSAAALSQATIFGGSIVNLIMNSREAHPNKNRSHRPLTDFNTILILEPMLLGGTVVGVLLNQILPNPIILVLLMLVLGIALYRMIIKGIAQYKKENEERANNLISGDSLVNQSLTGAYNDSSSVNKNNNFGYRGIEDDYDDSDSINVEELARKCGQSEFTLKRELTASELKELDTLVQKESNELRPMLWMAAVWIIVSVFALLRSGDFMLNVETCSNLYWILEFGVFPCLFLITFWIAKVNMSNFNRKCELHWKAAEGDIEWNIQKSIIYPTIAALSGLLGGLLGIGGGMIISPLLLELGVLPRVASATSAVAVLMTSSSSTFQKVLLNMIRYDYMVFFAGIGVVGTFVGQTVVNLAIKKFGRNSIVVAAVASVIACAIVLMGVNSVVDMTWSFELNSIC